MLTANVSVIDQVAKWFLFISHCDARICRALWLDMMDDGCLQQSQCVYTIIQCSCCISTNHQEGYHSVTLLPWLISINHACYSPVQCNGKCYGQPLHGHSLMYVSFLILIFWYSVWYCSKTRKLCYRKDDRAMRPTYGCPENFRDYLTTSTATIPNIFMGFCSGRPYECSYKIWSP